MPPDLLEDGLGSSEGPLPEMSCADLARDLIGSVDSGIDDLATNPAHLEAAIAEDYERGLRGLAD